MGARSIERQLRRVARHLVKVRDELEVAELQRAHLGDDTADAARRAVGGEDRLAARDHRNAEHHERAAHAHAERLRGDLARLEQEQDRLLDALTATRRSSAR